MKTWKTTFMITLTVDIDSIDKSMSIVLSLKNKKYIEGKFIVFMVLSCLGPGLVTKIILCYTL